MEYFQYNQTQLNNSAYELLLKNKRKKDMRKTFSGIGFAILCTNIIFDSIAILLQLILKISGTTDSIIYINNSLSINELIHAITSISSMLIIGLLYCPLSNTKLSDTVKFSKVKPSVIISSVAFALGIAYLSNNLTSMFLQNISLLGISNNTATSSMVSDSFSGMIVSLLVTAIIPAFSEEFLFRGIILGKLRKYGDSFAVIVSALMFGLIHGNIVQFPFAFVCGLGFGLLVVKTNSLLPSMIAHFLNNLLSSILNIIAFQTGGEDSQISIISNYLFEFLVFSFAIAGIVYLIKKQENFFHINPCTNETSEFSLKQKIATFFSSKGVVVAVVVIGISIILTLKFGY